MFPFADADVRQRSFPIVNLAIIGLNALVFLYEIQLGRGALLGGGLGLLAPMDARVETMMGIEHLERDDARAELEELDKARQDFFRKFFKARPNDPDLFHLMLNMGRLQTKTAAPRGARQWHRPE